MYKQIRKLHLKLHQKKAYIEINKREEKENVLLFLSSLYSVKNSECSEIIFRIKK